MSRNAIEDLDLFDKIVLVRVDFNVPFREEGTSLVVGDDTRMRAALPTIEYVLKRGGHPILMSHLGRPKGERVTELSLAPVAAHLQHLTGRNVCLVDDWSDPIAARSLFATPDVDIVLLENTRFDPREKSNDDSLADEFAALGDVFINDAFGSAHRAHASTEGVARRLRSAMGFLMTREIEYLSRVLDQPRHPFVAIIGGAKVSDKLGVIKHLLPRVDKLLIGGAMSYTFLKARGVRVGRSLVEDALLDDASLLLNDASMKIELPTDHVAASAFDNDADCIIVDGDIPGDYMGLDIGPATRDRYHRLVTDARMVVWNGPMGVFEMSNFAAGTVSVAHALVEATRGGATTVVGGGDSVAAITQAGLENDVSHVSTGGGAMLEFLEGKELPGVSALSIPSTTHDRRLI